MGLLSVYRKISYIYSNCGAWFASLLTYYLLVPMFFLSVHMTEKWDIRVYSPLSWGNNIFILLSNMQNPFTYQVVMDFLVILTSINTKLAPIYGNKTLKCLVQNPHLFLKELSIPTSYMRLCCVHKYTILYSIMLFQRNPELPHEVLHHGWELEMFRFR